MSLKRARDVSHDYERRSGGDHLAPTTIGKLARKGYVPIAARGKSGELLFSDRAVEALLARKRAREDGE